MFNRRLIAFLFPLLLAPLVSSAAGQVSVVHQGRLFHANDEPVNGSISLTIRFHTGETAGEDDTVVWEHTFKDLAVSNGVYSVVVGDDGQPALELGGWTAGEARWVSVAVDDGPELSPRMRFVPAPFASTAFDAQQLGGVPAGEYARTSSLDALAARIDALGTPGDFNDEANPVDWSRLKNVPGDLGAAPALSLAALDDVEAGTPQADDVLSWNGSAWVARAEQTPPASPHYLHANATEAQDASLLITGDAQVGGRVYDGAGEVTPVGAILPFAAATPPAGWLSCDGSEVSGAEYADLFAVIGETWGAGDDATTFHLPDLRGRFLRGVDAGAKRDPDRTSRTASNPGGAQGDAVGTIQEDQFQNHQHSYSYSYENPMKT